MKKDYNELARQVIELSGGKKNITNAWHCVTRLRFNLVNKDLVKLDEIKKVNGVMGAQFSGDQFQVIIGNEVEDAFDAVQGQLGNIATNDNESDEKPKENILSQLMDFISGTFTPAMPAVISAGLLKGVVAIIQSFKLMAPSSAGFAILQMVSDSAFYFLPFLLAVSAARKLKTNEYLAMSIAGILLYPTMVNGYNALAAGKHIATLKLFGVLPMPYLSYSSSVIPIMLAVWFLKYVYKWVKSWMPKSITIMFSPMLTMLIVAPVTLTILGPLGNYIGNGLAGIILWLFDNVGFVAGALLGGFWPLLVMTGMHWALSPIGLQIFSQQGFDNFLTPSTICATFAMAGATFAVFFKTKNEDMKQVSLSSGISAVLGITEPAMYGVTLKLKRPLIAAIIGGGIGGAIMNIFQTKSFGMSMPGLIAIPGFVDPHNSMNLIIAIIVSIASFAIAFVATWLIGFDGDGKRKATEEAVDTKNEATTPVQSTGKQIKIVAPVSGKNVPVEKVKDDTFAKQIMGETTAIEPSANDIVAPFEGEVTLVAETNHAIGLKSTDGVELLIHMGVDTVELKGKHFIPHVKKGDHVNQGDLLMEMDVEAVKSAGYDPVILCIVTNTADYVDVISMVEAEDIVVGDNIAAAVE
ncbi:beta-glucoside-specific PTS transporter subunit IIABC [Lactobacillus sp. ESL0681]|uniref:beta-glucoside-specific PTS transporter subunit IIABC n=1 Tax=Lactobacillus sp. ESL0681 TaxID=2983211 RepID=UPI0023F74ED6|nr:beta-glucoside-specific PTS transporter subunit IIABC [Lactobacillus sp. ESL0681]WEV39547.1 beta-glucoside-specific PTS transporter subunit IIABC [Lactobacillus sp. ESL0681]